MKMIGTAYRHLMRNDELAAQAGAAAISAALRRVSRIIDLKRRYPSYAQTSSKTIPVVSADWQPTKGARRRSAAWESGLHPGYPLPRMSTQAKARARGFARVIKVDRGVGRVPADLLFVRPHRMVAAR
jgi:hypothetical protein